MGRFRDGFGTVSGRSGVSDSLGTVSGRFWVPKAENSPEENQGAVRNSPRAAGHQISSIIRVPSRSFAALPAYPRVPLSEQTSSWKRQFWRVPPRKRYERNGRSRRHDIRRLRRDAACRSDPTFTRASPGLAVAEQLPQIISFCSTDIISQLSLHNFIASQHSALALYEQRCKTMQTGRRAGTFHVLQQGQRIGQTLTL